MLVALSNWLKTYSWAVHSFLFEYDVLLALPIVKTHHELAAIILLINIISRPLDSPNYTTAQNA